MNTMVAFADVRTGALVTGWAPTNQPPSEVGWEEAERVTKFRADFLKHYIRVRAPRGA